MVWPLTPRSLATSATFLPDAIRSRTRRLNSGGYLLGMPTSSWGHGHDESNDATPPKWGNIKHVHRGGVGLAAVVLLVGEQRPGETGHGTLMTRDGRGGHEQLPVDDLPPEVVVGEAPEVLVREAGRLGLGRHGPPPTCRRVGPAYDNEPAGISWPEVSNAEIADRR